MPIYNQGIKAAVLLTLLALSGHATASCNVVAHIEGSISGWPTRVANSSNDRLRTAYAANSCTFTIGEHGGGQIPPGAGGDTHVTVRIDTAPTKTCHVFKLPSNAPQEAETQPPAFEPLVRSNRRWTTW
ncbi:hypothetical protein N8D55_10080 [Xanthomonas hortorum pv. pelargonii]|nr:hypothetical protein N8D55_10080 [Xanthomonas hortorum pv. pelargonii]